MQFLAERGPKIQPRRTCLTLALAVFCACGCGTKSTRPVVSPTAVLESEARTSVRPDPSATEASIRTEFLDVARRLVQSENRYLGRGQIHRLLQAEQAATDVGESVNIQLQLCWNHLRLGNLEQATSAIDKAFQMVLASGHQPQPSMHKLRGLVYLRDAEFQNCVQRHNRDCCVFPLQGGGIHTLSSPAEKARDEFLRLLKLQPDDLEMVWLLNVTSQATGDYPQGVPEAFRIPEDAFESDPDAPNLTRFSNIATELGVDTFNLCGGAIVEDFNGDGLLDIVTSSYDPHEPLIIYTQTQGNFGFTQRQISSQLGGLNCIAADYDGDADMDVLVLRGAWLEDDGQIRNSLLQNDGQGNFVDVTAETGLGEVARPTQTAVWGDFDNDGDLDVYIGNESRMEFDQAGRGDYPSQLYRNNGNGTFTDVAIEAGVTNDRYCKGVAAGDYDNDGDLDIYVSNRGPNRLYRNNGDGTFDDVAAQLGVTDPRLQSFACWFFDHDNDGWLDLFVTAYQATNADVAASYIGAPHHGVAPCLYRNQGDGTFRNVTGEMNLDHAWLPMGANFGDIDNDGFLDIYLTTGRPDFATLTPNVMLRNAEGRRYQDVTTATGLGHLQKGHGVAFADVDHDGDQDIYHQLGGFYPGDKFHNALFENPLQDRQSLPSSRHRFIHVTLQGGGANSRAIGARLRVVVAMDRGEREIHRAVGMVSSFGGSPLKQEIGLGPASEIKRLEVTWPAVHGKVAAKQVFTGLPLDSFVRIQQGSDAVVSQRRSRSSTDR